MLFNDFIRTKTALFYDSSLSEQQAGCLSGHSDLADWTQVLARQDAPTGHLTGPGTIDAGRDTETRRRGVFPSGLRVGCDAETLSEAARHPETWRELRTEIEFNRGFWNAGCSGCFRGAHVLFRLKLQPVKIQEVFPRKS